MQALADLKVLEFGQFISAAFAAKLLGDFGAEVIKIEPPGGDEARRHGPFPNDVPHPEKSGLFLNLNTNKLGVTLDPRTPAGRDVFIRLARESDIVVSNFRASELQAWGLDGGTLRKEIPRLISTSVTVFGNEGPRADDKGYAITAAAAGGMAYRIGHPDRSPLTTPFDRSDYWGAISAAGATMMAVMAREQTGEGQHVDISSAEVMGNFINCQDFFQYLDGEPYNVRAGRRIKSGYPWVIFPVKDGHFFCITAQGRHWDRFVDLMGNPEWSKEPRYQDRIAMGREYPEEVDALVEPWVAPQSKWELWERCRELNIPFQVVSTAQDVMSLDHLKERGYWRSIQHPEAGDLTYPGPPFQMSETPSELRRPAPRLGEHNELVYLERLGIPAQEMSDLYRAGVI